MIWQKVFHTGAWPGAWSRVFMQPVCTDGKQDPCGTLWKVCDCAELHPASLRVYFCPNVLCHRSPGTEGLWVSSVLLKSQGWRNAQTKIKERPSKTSCWLPENKPLSSQYVTQLTDNHLRKYPFKCHQENV